MYCCCVLKEETDLSTSLRRFSIDVLFLLECMRSEEVSGFQYSQTSKMEQWSFWKDSSWLHKGHTVTPLYRSSVGPDPFGNPLGMFVMNIMLWPFKKSLGLCGLQWAAILANNYVICTDLNLNVSAETCTHFALSLNKFRALHASQKLTYCTPFTLLQIYTKLVVHLTCNSMVWRWNLSPSLRLTMYSLITSFATDHVEL